MGIKENDKIPSDSKITWEEAYKKISNYSKDFMSKWLAMNDASKENFIFGNGSRAGLSGIKYVNDSEKYVSELLNSVTKQEALKLAKEVIYGKLEYLYHEKNNLYKMSAYAHYIVEKIG